MGFSKSRGVEYIKNKCADPDYALSPRPMAAAAFMTTTPSATAAKKPSPTSTTPMPEAARPRPTAAIFTNTRPQQPPQPLALFSLEFHQSQLGA